MPITNFAFPFSGTTPGQAGPYSDDDFARWVASTIQFAGQDGVCRGVLNELEVLATSPVSAQVTVGTGAVLIQGRWGYVSSAQTFTIAANGSANPRLDVVIAEVDYVNQQVSIKVLQGTPAVSPGLPSLTQNSVLWQIYIAYILVVPGFATLAQTTIIDMRTFANIPDSLFLRVTNQSASTLQRGAVVRRVTSPVGSPVAVNTTTSFGDATAIGIVESRMLAGGGLGRILTRGITTVLVGSAVAVGDLLTTSNVAGQAFISSNGIFRSFGTALTAASGAGQYILAYVDFRGNDLNPTVPHFHAFSTTDQIGLVAGVTTKITFPSEDFDTPSTFYDTATSRYTVVSAAFPSRYFFYASVELFNSAAGAVTAFVELQKNGVSIARQSLSIGGSGTAPFFVARGVDMVSGDFVEVYANIPGSGGNAIKTSRAGGFGGFLENQ